MEQLTKLTENLKITANIPPKAANFEKFDNGLSNFYIFEVKPGTRVYRYDIEIKLKGETPDKDRPLTKGGGDDGKKWLNRELCHEILNTVYKSTSGFNTNGQAQLVYDNCKILYTNVKVDAMAFIVGYDQLSEFCQKHINKKSVEFALQPCSTDAFELNLSDLTSGLQQSVTKQANHSLRTFFEMLTSQPFIDKGGHKVVGAGRLFEVKEAKRLTEAITTHRGVAKGARIIQNGGKVPCMALALDVKQCAFYVADNLQKIAMDMFDNACRRRNLNTNDRKQMELFWNDFGQLFKGVSCYLTYAPSRLVVIDAITTRNCSEFSFDVNGGKMTMVEFFRTKKNISINPNMPAVRQQIDRDSVFPLACLEVLPFQRLTLEKMALNDGMGQISRDLLAANAVNPVERYRSIENEVRKIGADGDCAAFMLQFNARLVGGRNNVEIGLMAMPKIQFGRMQDAPRDDKGRFDVRGPIQYVEPSKVLKSWVVGYTRRIGEQQFSKFIGDIIQMSKRRGMEIPQPVYQVIELNQMNEMMKQLSDKKVQFMLYIDNKFVKSHSSLKLFERKHNVLTQHVTIEMAQKAGPASVSNVLNKMNMKLFGLNYLVVPNQACKAKFDLVSGNVLVVGMDTSRPPPATAFELYKLKKNGMGDLKSEEPMVVGFCANYLKNPVKFVGDYYFQPCKQDMLNPKFLTDKMLWMLKQLLANRGGNPSNLPKTVFIIRDGASEGMVPNLLKNAEGGPSEYEAFVQVCRTFHPQWQPKFIYSIVDKRHNKRFFVNQQPGQGQGGSKGGNAVSVANTKPGSVIDRKFVRVDMHEFYLQAHYPLKGCSKIPQYVIPVNEVKADNNELQAFLHALCNMWQIVNLAPALPTPVLQAKELAKRGRNNYMELKRNNQLPFVPNTLMINYDRLNTMVAYASGCPLVGTRFNA